MTTVSKDIVTTRYNGADVPLPQHENESGQMVLTGGKNPLPIKASHSEVTLHNAATAITTGTALKIGAEKTITLEIFGTSSARTVIFEAAGASGVFRPISGIKLSDLTTRSQTTNTDELWQFDITGLHQFRANLTAVSGGNVSVKGKVIS